MATDEGDEGNYRLGGLSGFQTGIAFLLLASVLILYVAYQIKTGRVFTKSGEIPLGAGMPWAWLTIESVAAIVGIVRGVRLIRTARRDQFY